MQEQELERRKKLSSLRESNKDPYLVEKVPCTHSIKEVLSYSSLPNSELETLNVSLIGRVISMRQSFLTIRDSWNDLQIYISSKNSSQELLDYYKNLVDIGDYLFIKGNFFRTGKGEFTLRVNHLKIISKCINPFPSQYYGIQDKELQVRNRVARALVDKDFYDVVILRSRIIFELRNFLNSMGYIEIETPVLESVYGGANAVPFQTHYAALKENFFLRIATEIPLKKIAISGFPRIYEIGKVFRNEGIDSTHNPEFTSLEIYTANYGLEDTMNLTESIFKHLSKTLNIEKVTWGDHKIDLSKDFKRLFMSDLVKEKTGVDFYREKVDLERAIGLADKHRVNLMNHEKKVGHVFHRLFEELVEPYLIEPTFIYGFHKDVSPLSKIDPNNREFTLRYELYIGSKEFSNGFSELNDPDDQRDRFLKQYEERKLGNEEAFGIDEDYLFALQYALPPTGGIGIGIDRVVMLFSGKSSIKEVIFFPHLKK